MALITKSQLAALLDLSTARISQYVKLGLPVRSDGRLNLDQALNWIVANIPLSDDPNKGSAKAAQLVKHGVKRQRKTVGHESGAYAKGPPVAWLQPVHEAENPFDQGWLMGTILSARDVRALAQIAAFDAGCDQDKAKEIGDRFFCLFAETGAETMTEFGIGPFARNPDAPIWPTEPGYVLNWENLEMQRDNGNR